MRLELFIEIAKIVFLQGDITIYHSFTICRAIVYKPHFWGSQKGYTEVLGACEASSERSTP